MKNQVLTLLVVGLQGIAMAQSSQEVISRSLEALGGEARLKEIKTVKAKVEMETVGMDMTGMIVYKAPNLQYSEFEIMGGLIKSGFNGLTGWMVNPLTGSGEAIDLKGQQLESARRNSFRQLLLDAASYEIEDLGMQSMDKKEYRALRFTGNEISVVKYFDTATWLPVWDETQSATLGPVYLYYEDYKPVDGITMATTITTFVGTQRDTPTAVMKLKEITLNESVDVTIFEKP